MDIDYDKIRDLLERVTSGNVGEVVASFNFKDESCAITWKRPRGVLGHESWSSRIEVLLYVKELLMDAGVGVNISMESTLEWITPEE